MWMRDPTSTDYEYPGQFNFSDEGVTANDGNLVQYLYNSNSAKQYEYFVTPVSYGLTKA